jgi:hypothetical protein
VYVKAMLILLAALVMVIALQATKRPPQVPAPVKGAAAPGPGIGPGHGREVFDRRIGELRLEGASLREAVDVLRAKTGANIAVRWAALNIEADDARLGPEARMDVSLRDVSLGAAVRAIVQTTEPPLRYGLKDGVVVITGFADMDLPTRPDVYDVRELLPPGAPESAGPYRLQPTRPRPPQPFGGLFGAVPPDKPLDKLRNLVDRVLVLRQTDRSGLEGWGGQLVLRNTPEQHRRVSALLQGMRGAALASRRAPSSQPATDEGMHRRLRELRLDGVTPDAAIERLRAAYDANIAVNWPVLQFIDREEKSVHLRLSGVKLPQALDVLCAALSGETDELRLAWREEEGVVYVATEARLAGVGTPRVFDVHDLIEKAVAFRRRHGDTRPAMEDPDGGEPQSPSDFEGGKLRRVILETVEPDSWRSGENRFSSGVIEYWSGRLIVQHRPSVQKRVGELLDRMRDQKPETRGP